MDGVLIANELIDEAQKWRKEVVLFKVDFEKAYYLDWIMDRMGFVAKWRAWILECLSMTFVSVLVSGSPTKKFRVGCGLRQGDPLSPFLFLIAVEGFRIFINKAVEINLFEGYRFGAVEKQVYRLQFTDDILLLCKKIQK